MSTGTSVVRCGTLFDGTGTGPLTDATVVIADGRISAVGRADRTVAPPGAPVLDLRDRFVMPGLVDAHSHISIVPAKGNQVGQYTDVTTDVTSCPSGGPYDNCDMLLPIMQTGQGSGANATAFVTAFAVFHVTDGHTGVSAHTAHYVGTTPARFTVYYRNPAGGWLYLTQSPLLPVAPAYAP